MRSIYEKDCQKRLEKDGYLVDYKIRPRIVPKGYKVDFFGLFDLISYKAGEPIRWIAIKGKQGGYAPLREKINRFFMPEGNQKELWRYTKGIKHEPKIELFHQIISNELPKPKKGEFDVKAFIESAKKARDVFEEEEKEQYERKLSK